MSNLFCLIMAGGKGTRFWPESTRSCPKQYLNLFGKKSLLEQTIGRLYGLIPKNRRFLVTTGEQAHLARKLSKGLIGKNGIIFEPEGRNTAPCILLALVSLLDNGADSEDSVAILPADHVILNKKGFQKTIRLASQMAVSQDKIVTVGIHPSFPHTGYGYIQRGELVSSSVFHVKGFKEKPNLELAQHYLETGEYFWNGGIFVGTIKAFLREYSLHAPEIFQYTKELVKSHRSLKRLKSLYKKIPAKSIDYAIMEKSENILVVPAEFDWNDLGSWDALSAVVQATAEGNIVAKSRGSYFKNSKNNILFVPNQFVGLIGVNDLIVVSNQRGLLIFPRNEAQAVKDLVEHLQGVKEGKKLL